jgi:hypothetical protein
MQFADAARRQAHIDAGQCLRDRQFPFGDLPRPAAVLNALVGLVEGKPEIRQAAVIRGRRRFAAGELAGKRRIAWSGIGYAGWIALRGVRSLRGGIGIAEPSGVREGGRHDTAGRRGGQNVAT